MLGSLEAWKPRLKERFARRALCLRSAALEEKPSIVGEDDRMRSPEAWKLRSSEILRGSMAFEPPSLLASQLLGAYSVVVMPSTIIKAD
ncbi:hypothetical protein JY97_06035 [Alkalispirochaeta odontotermitis]|nr:hypothetical protein JY97_06035 [Alkalispirochaeta odontotermitis]CAB1079153.1 hypothetical protein D1AOALGA4SA_6869 [Olavius algarvensis Delta 1 endosymbiont]